MQIPTFPECEHDIVRSLAPQSDYELVTKFQLSPTDGRYFAALFCRYSSVVYSLIRHSARSPVQADYLFALTWRHILYELGGVDLAAATPPAKAPTNGSQPVAAEFSLQAWLISLTAAYINQAVLPDVESIHYALKDAPPPLWCYTNRALDAIAPKYRLMILMAQTLEWSETRIAAYLQAEGEQSSAPAVREDLAVAYQSLERALPEDIRAIYLDYSLAILPVPEENQGRMTIEFDQADLQV